MPQLNRSEQAEKVCRLVAEHFQNVCIDEQVFVGSYCQRREVNTTRAWPDVELPADYSRENGAFFNNWRRFCGHIADPTHHARAILSGALHIALTAVPGGEEERRVANTTVPHGGERGRVANDLLKLLDSLSDDGLAPSATSIAKGAGQRRAKPGSAFPRPGFHICSSKIPEFDGLATLTIAQRVYIGLSMELKEVRSALSHPNRIGTDRDKKNAERNWLMLERNKEEAAAFGQSSQFVDGWLRYCSAITGEHRAFALLEGAMHIVSVCFAHSKEKLETFKVTFGLLLERLGSHSMRRQKSESEFACDTEHGNGSGFGSEAETWVSDDGVGLRHDISKDTDMSYPRDWDAPSDVLATPASSFAEVTYPLLLDTLGDVLGAAILALFVVSKPREEEQRLPEVSYTTRAVLRVPARGCGSYEIAATLDRMPSPGVRLGRYLRKCTGKRSVKKSGYSKLEIRVDEKVGRMLLEEATYTGQISKRHRYLF